MVKLMISDKAFKVMIDNLRNEIPSALICNRTIELLKLQRSEIKQLEEQLKYIQDNRRY